MNNLGRQSDPTRYKEKEILLQPSVDFSDIITLLGNFDILDKKDIDIISRIHEYTSRSVHIGSFFDSLVAWYLLFYLQDVKRNPPTIQAFLTNSIEEFVNTGKSKVVSDSDVVSNYSRFQTTSKQLKKLKKTRLARKPEKE